VLKGLGALVVESAISVELALHPHTIVCWLTLTVVEHTLTVYLIVFEFTLVVGSILEDQSAVPFFLVVDDLSFVTVAFLIHKLTILPCIFLCFFYLFFKLFCHFILVWFLQRPPHTHALSVWLPMTDFDSLQRLDNVLSFRIEEAILDGFLQSRLFEFVDVCQIFPDHLKQLGISVNILFVFSRFRRV